MQSPEDRPSLDAPGCLDSSSARSVLGKRQMRADVIVGVGITGERMPKVPLPKHDDVVKAFPPHRSNQALRAAVLPWRTGRCRVIADAQQSNSPHEYRSIAAIAVTDQKPGRPLPATGFHELICKPLRRRMRRDAKPQDLPPAVPHDQQSIEKAERAGRHPKQIHRGDAVCVIAQKVFQPCVELEGANRERIAVSSAATVTQMPRVRSSKHRRRATQSDSLPNPA